jgi:hypothetical protein
MARAFSRSVLTVFGATAALGLTLAGCTAGPLSDRVSDKMPESLGGLPAGAPARPATPYQYPAVHDMPAPRAAPTLTEEERSKLEKELQTVRDRQLAQEGQGPAKKAGKKAAPETKKPADSPIYVPPASDTKTSGAKTNP